MATSLTRKDKAKSKNKKTQVEKNLTDKGKYLENVVNQPIIKLV